MAKRENIRLYEYTLFVGQGPNEDPPETASRIHDLLVRDGLDISNAVIVNRTTKAAMTERFHEAGLL